MAPRSAYIHVPFCKYRCGYCDFAIVANRDDLVGAYLDAIAAELSWLGEPRKVDTLYFGGGTPSHLEAGPLRRLGETVRRWHPLAAGGEWTVEANPESLTADRVDVLAELGVTRLSLGAQSLDDAKLRSLERNHDRGDVLRSMEYARAAGMQVSVDLMFAAPGETLELWRRDLAAVIELAPDHISTYGLTWEPGAAFTVKRDKGLLRPLDEELERTMYGEAIDRLAAAGFEHYEVSNFARPGRRSRHNEVYWAGSEYFAAGPGAARYVDGVRSTNHRSTTTYLKRVAAGESPVFEQEELNAEERAHELLVLGLRRLEGIDRASFAAKAGYEVDAIAGEAIRKFVELGLLSDDGSRVKLTREGLFVSDGLWPELL
ncbi:radical SAM family heme chaperone HemW [Lacipirellula parvula]|uniref:Heme chaperone HemW n=1 Tax=Lacipirellula parvula TaxID=2650471 RepID=A0A5K7X3Y8_9BACT|nr:radical SAM family heme chaperone HemW [Lacipirellula parvula]BBO31338.1 radical SAM family enzyme [Lacipirellula parvula]